MMQSKNHRVVLLLKKIIIELFDLCFLGPWQTGAAINSHGRQQEFFATLVIFPPCSSEHPLPSHNDSLLESPLYTHIHTLLFWKIALGRCSGDEQGPSQGHTCSLGAPPSSCSGNFAELPGMCSRDRIRTGIRSWLSSDQLCSQEHQDTPLGQELAPSGHHSRI